AADAVLAGVLLAERHRAHHALARRVDGVVGRAVAVVVGARRAVAPRRLDGAHAGAPAAARAAVGRDAGARARAADADAVSQRVAAARLGRADHARARVVDGVVGRAVADVVGARRAAARPRHHRALTLGVARVDAGARALPADADLARGPALDHLALDALAAAVRRPVAVRVVALHEAAVGLGGAHRARALAPVARLAVGAADAGALARRARAHAVEVRVGVARLGRAGHALARRVGRVVGLPVAVVVFAVAAHALARHHRAHAFAPH